MNIVLEANLKLDSSHSFNVLRNYLLDNKDVIQEIEAAFAAVLSKIDPSDRGNRFVSGAAFEWILAAACGAAGVAALPGGHSQDSFDLLSLRDNMRGMWSVKSSTTKSLGAFRLSNTMNNSESKFTTPTVFLHPKLPGLVYVDPKMTPSLVSNVKTLKDATTLSGKLILEYAKLNFNMVIPLTTPTNLKNGKGDPYLDFVANLLTSGTYPTLGPLISDLRENARTFQVLRSQFEKGILGKDQYQIMIDDLYGKI